MPTTGTSEAPLLPTLGVSIVNYRTPDLTIESLRAIAPERAAFAGLRVIAADGHSEDGSAERIAGAIAANGWSGWATALPLPVNGGFAWANNQAFAALARDCGWPDLVALVNPDARVTPGALAALARRLAGDPAIGAVGALLVHEDGTPQGSAFSWPSVRGEFARGARTGLLERVIGARPPAIAATEARPVDWVTGAAVMFRTEALRDAGLFDEGFFLYFEETELMRRLSRAGWSIWHEPDARVVHLAGRATNLRDPETGRALAKRLPAYWYEARRRYFALTGGRARAIAAGLAYLAGRLVWQARCLLTGRPDDEPERTTRDFVALSLWPRARDLRPHPRPFADPACSAPAWMERGA